MNLVTGATGHIGNVLVRELLGRGERVRVLVRPGRMHRALRGLDVEIAPGDVLDTASLKRATRDIQVVYHLAARISLETGPDPETEQVNHRGTLNVIEAARHSNIRRLVYASSIYALHKPPDGVPIDEGQPFDALNCQGAYDCSKARASLAVQRAVADGLDAVIVCPTAVTGPYDFHDSEAGRAIRLYMRPGMRFYIDGGYDFIDVRDAAQGFILAAEKGRSGETYILSGDRMTVRDVARTVWAATGRGSAGLHIPLGLAYMAADVLPFICELTGGRPFFTRYSLDAICSNSHISHAKASRELGFEPRPARQAVLDAVGWLRENTLLEAGKLAAESKIEAAV
ncbi:MAG TPA: NAD-dependent epimerase/dehydratase family protein [Anaerolineales bacterium]|nr:NAD-dependent epimerase/dehydratase family protein [Anaerolineales bacterium]